MASTHSERFPDRELFPVYEATVNSKPRIRRGYRRPPLDPLLSQPTTPQPPPEPGGELDKFQPIGYSASVWLETR